MKNATRYLSILIMAYLAVWMLRLGLTSQVGHDDVEHIHTAWLMNQGLAPFTDFFQKQSPVFWHLLRPLVALSGDSFATVLLLARGLMLLFLALTVAGATALARSLVSRSNRALICPALLLASPVLLYNLAVVRPDGVMVCLLMWGCVLLERFLRRGTGHGSLFASGTLFGLAGVVLLKAVPFVVLLAGLVLLFPPAGGSRGLRQAIPGLLVFCAGITTTVAPFLLWLLGSDQFEEFYFFNVVFNGELYRNPPPFDVPWSSRIFQVLATALKKEPWTLLVPPFALLLLSVRFNRLRFSPNLPALAIVLVLLCAGLVMLPLNRLPFYNYFLVPFVAGPLLAPWLWEQFAHLFEDARFSLTTKKRVLFDQPAVRLLGCVATALVLTHATNQFSRFPTSEAQVEKIAGVEKGRDDYKLPYLPVFEIDPHRIWDNVDRYRHTFRSLEDQGKVPEWAKELYSAEYAP